MLSRGRVEDLVFYSFALELLKEFLSNDMAAEIAMKNYLKWMNLMTLLGCFSLGAMHPVDRAIMLNNRRAVENLITRENVNDIIDEHPLWTPLHVAVFAVRFAYDENEALRIIQVLLKRGANPNKYDRLDRAPIHLAESLRVRRLLLDYGAHINLH